MSFTFRLKESNIDRVKSIALDVSNPNSANYGKYLSIEQLAEMTSPAPAALEAVTAWLDSHAIEYSIEQNRRVIVTAARGTAAKLLNTSFSLLTNAAFDQNLVRAGQFELPTEVDSAVAAVYGLHGLPLPPRRSLMADGEPAKVTPAVIEKTYSVSGVTPSGSDTNRQAVAEFQGQYMADADLVKFFTDFVPGAKSDDKVDKFVGDPNKQEGQAEASLDIQYIMGVNPGLKSEFWLYNSMDFCGDLEKWSALILNTTNAPTVHSVSYGWQGDLAKIGCQASKVTVVDDNLAKLAAAGFSIIFASGDSGSGYSPMTEAATSNAQCGGKAPSVRFHGEKLKTDKNAKTEAQCCEAAEKEHAAGWTFALTKKRKHVCILWSSIAGTKPCANPSQCHSARTSGPAPPTPPGPPTPPPKGVKLWPSWPASSPWVTAVGATRFVDQTVGQPEMATDQFGSGGGFSDMWNVSSAEWQASATKSYLANAPQLPPAGSYPPMGRGTPDVAALGEGYQVVIHGETQSIGGTSASAPAFAGLVALLNEARIAKKMPPMGFLNPWLYNNTGMFTDVILGSNKFGRGSFSLKYGWNCTKGWDPVTGLGTPIFSKMLEAALN